MQTLLIATHNRGKLREYRTLLADLPLTVINLDEAGISVDVEETGTTFTDNALLKARAYAAMSGHLCWADDSGLEVDALDGAPGVYSARYAGPSATDEDRCRKLLDALAARAGAKRTARFRCVVALATPKGDTYTANGVCEGEITDAPRGTNGFGYDPVFFIPTMGKTMAELEPEVKNRISHRGRAAAVARQILTDLLGAHPSGPVHCDGHATVDM